MNLKLEPDRTAWDLKWTMFGIPVRVHPLFWLVMLGLFYNKYLPFEFVLIAIVCGFFSILVHEYGHAFSQRHYGDHNNHIVLFWFGGLAVGSREVRGFWPKVITLLWGPGAGFILCAIAGALLFSLYGRSYLTGADHLHWTLYILFWINLVWGLVNLLPIFPLDGGQIMRETVNYKAPQRGDAFAFTISFYAAIIAAIAVISLYFLKIQDGMSTFFNSLLFLALAYSSWSIRRMIGQYGSLGGGEERREAWEQDPDWWKR
jgi:stage IV sporulation protein FB